MRVADVVSRVQTASNERETRFGKVLLDWSYAITSGKLTMKLTVPIGAMAEVHALSAVDGGRALVQVDEASTLEPLWTAAAGIATRVPLHFIHGIEQTPAAVVTTVRSGEHLFTMSYSPGVRAL